MSVPVELDALRDRIADHGSVAYLLTVNDDGSPHVVSVVVEVVGDELVVPLGRRTRANVARSPEVTLLWPTGPDPAYSLIVDATAADPVDSVDTVALRPRFAVLHRVAGADGDGPACVPVGEP